MTNWEPTPELRWIKKQERIPCSGGGNLYTGRPVVLQQKWTRMERDAVIDEIGMTTATYEKSHEKEWRDVPTVGGGG